MEPEFVAKWVTSEVATFAVSGGYVNQLLVCAERQQASSRHSSLVLVRAFVSTRRLDHWMALTQIEEFVMAGSHRRKTRRRN
jgi:hypothetical protein